MRLKRRSLAWLPIIVCGALSLFFWFQGSSARFGSDGLRLFLNVVFSTVLPLAVVLLLFRIYWRQSLLGAFFLGSGLFMFSMGSLGSGVAQFLWPTSRVNAGVTIHNLSLLCASLYMVASALLLLYGVKPKIDRKGSLFLAGLAGLLGITAVIWALGPSDLIPDFFVQGVGPTPLRQVVLHATTVLFTVAATVLLVAYQRSRDLFSYWFSLGLLLLLVNLCGIFHQTAVGTALNWTARAAQYLAGVYFLVAVATARTDTAKGEGAAEEAIRAFFSGSEVSYRLLVEHSPDIIMRLSRDCRHEYINPAVGRVTGLPVGFFLGRTVRDVFREGEGAAGVERAVRQVFAERREQSAEVEVATQYGPKAFACRFVPELDGSGNVKSVLNVARDITDRKLAEKGLRQAKEEAEEASRAKSLFLANMSHEIRTPLNGVLGMTDLALMEDVSPQAREFLHLARQSGQTLLEIINDILDLSKIEAGKVLLEKKPFCLRECVEATLGALRVGAREKGLDFRHAIDPGLPDRLVGDQGRLRQVLTNLVGNAVKFTEQGAVSVSVARDAAPTAPGTVALVFTVQDDGIGIPADRLEAVFDSFSQAGLSTHAKYGGTGLGLSIAKALAEMMGGRIWARSAVGKGSTFCFSAVFGLAGQADGEGGLSAPPRPGPAASGLRCLLVEDNAVNQTLAMAFLTSRGHAVVAVENGRKALEALARDVFDAVFMDVRMPEMDGEEATRRIRRGEVPGLDPRIPIVAMTAHALQGDRERLLAAGMDDYLSKPIQLEALDRVLERLAAGGYGR